MRPETGERKRRLLLRTAALLLACGLIFLGTQSGEAALVFRKATAICLECIGIG